jgi:uncharacterized membrane protein
MIDAIILFGGILLFIALPLAILGYVSHWRVKQSEKQPQTPTAS